MSQIDEWMAEESTGKPNTALVVTSGPGEGKKVLLTQWIRRHVADSRKEFPDIIVPSFVTYGSSENSPNSIIYRVVVRLREIFNIRQRLELSEERLRINFSYWLDLASRKMKNLKYFDGNLVVVIEGVSHVADQDRHAESSLKFWLPRVLPDRVKLILAVSRESHNLEYLRKIGCRFLELRSNSALPVQLGALHENRMSMTEERYGREVLKLIQAKLAEGAPQQHSSFFVKSIYGCLLPDRPVATTPVAEEAALLMKKTLTYDSCYEALKTGLSGVKDTEGLLSFLLTFYSTKFSKADEFATLLAALCLNLKGLTRTELTAVSGVSEVNLEALTTVLKPWLVDYHGYIKVTNLVLLQHLGSHQLKQTEIRATAHRRIATVLESSPTCLRQLEELTGNLYLAGDFFQLKQKISSIDNFLLLFNEVTKYELFKFWKRLEEKGYDPIHEYNKSLELFDMHFNPKDDEIFMINVQLARFFKELSEFESPITPEFRHPLIRGKVVQAVESIDYKFRKQESAPERQTGPSGFYELDPAFRGLRISKGDLFERFRSYATVFDARGEEVEFGGAALEDVGESDGRLKNYLEEIGILQELRAIGILDSGNDRILKEHEALNVEIPLNRVKFLDYFHGILKARHSLRRKTGKRATENYAFKVADEGEEKKNPDQLMLMSDQKEVVDSYTKMILDIDLSIEQSQPKMFYYYKRWIWMNYPWICLSKERIDFSALIAFCYSDDKSFLNNEQEAALYFRCLQIIYNCKEKKSSIFRNEPTDYPLEQPLDDADLKFKTGQETQTQTRAESGHEAKVADSAEPAKQRLPSVRKVGIKADLREGSRAERHKQSQILGPCMETMSKDQQSRILSIVGNASHNVSITKLTTILQKSKFLEDSVMKNNMLDMQRLVFGGQPYDPAEIYRSKIDSLNIVLDKWSQKEVGLLRRKNEQIVAELNAVVFKKQKLMQEIAKLEEQKAFKQLHDQSVLRERDDEAANINTVYERKIREMHERLRAVLEQKKRYQEIIDICAINQISNEEWIRGLNFYLANLKKVRADQERQLQVKSSALEARKAECKKVYEAYLSNKEKRAAFLRNFKRYIRQKEEIDRAIVLSDQKIVKEVKGRLLQETGQSRLEHQKINESTIKASKLHQDQELERRLAECMELYKKIRPLVAKNYPPTDPNAPIDVLEDYDEDWAKNPRFQQFMSNLQMSRKLEVSLSERKNGTYDSEKRSP